MSVKRLLIMSGACGVLATAISSALAQDTGEVAEVVIVTGSYIRGTPEDAALPVDVISSEELEKIDAERTQVGLHLVDLRVIAGDLEEGGRVASGNT